MQCERLLKLSKNWIVNVKDETMAPARMIQFIKEHVETCDLCIADPDIQGEIEQITTLILPESKIPKAVRLQQEKENSYAEEEREAKREEEEKREEEKEKGDGKGEEEEEEEEEEEKYIDDDEENLDEDLTDLK